MKTFPVLTPKRSLSGALLVGLILLGIGIVFSPPKARAMDLAGSPVTKDGSRTQGARSSSDIDRPELVYPADLDGDGDQDVLAATGSDKKVVWYENKIGEEEGGTDGFGSPQIIAADVQDPRSMTTADLDGNGDQDVLLSYGQGLRRGGRDEYQGAEGKYKPPKNLKTVWYENRIGEGGGTADGFAEPRTIARRGGQDWSLRAADLDGDGDPDVLSVHKTKISTAISHRPDTVAVVWYENKISESGADPHGFGSPQSITSRPNHSLTGSIYIADLDKDGDADVLSGSKTPSQGHTNIKDQVFWYENQIDEGGTDSDGFGDRIVIGENAPGFFASGDLDADGDLDIIDQEVWYPNLTGESEADSDGFGPVQEISSFGPFVENITRPFTPSFTVASDLDGDGDQDLLSKGTWNEKGIANRSGLDRNDKIVWLENQQGEIPADGDRFEERGTITDEGTGTSVPVYAVDLDGDGDDDLLSAFEFDDEIFWCENQIGETGADSDGFGLRKFINESERTEIEVSEREFSSIQAADLDGDGDQDALAAFSEIFWYENQGGQREPGTGRFTNRQTIAKSVDRPEIFTVDLNGDGKQDLLSASRDGTFAWYENQIGKSESDSDGFGDQQVITTKDEEGRSVYAADLDGDGDKDVLTASRNYDKIAWHENQIGESAADRDGFGPQQVITIVSAANVVHAADLDGDGDQDVLAAGFDQGSGISWYENKLEEGNGFGPKQEIHSPDAHKYTDLYTSDVDGDGDPDVLSTPSGGTSFGYSGVVWTENRVGESGAGSSFGEITSFLTPRRPRNAGNKSSIYAADLDGDGDPDGIYGVGYVSWNRNVAGKGQGLRPIFGKERDVLLEDADLIYPADLDGDGDLDILYATEQVGQQDPEFGWYENTPERIPRSK